MYMLSVIRPDRQPSRHTKAQILRLDRRYLTGNYLTEKELDRGILFCRMDEDTIVAYVLLEQYPATYTIRSVVVVPEYRGEGVAKALVKSCMRWVRKQEINTIHTYASATNYPSINMLVGVGFKVIRSVYCKHKTDPNWISFKIQL